MEPMKILFVWSSIFGLHPYHSFQDHQQPKLLNFLLSGWCFLVLIFQTLFIVGLCWHLSGVVQEQVSSGTPIIFVISVLLHNVSAIIGNLIPRYLCLRSWYFRRSLMHLKAFDGSSAENCQGTLTTRKVCLGLLLGMIWVLYEIWLAMSQIKTTGNLSAVRLGTFAIWRSLGYAHQICIHVCIYSGVTIVTDHIKIMANDFKQLAKKFEAVQIHEAELYLFRRIFSTPRLNQGLITDFTKIKIRLNHTNRACDNLIKTFSPFVLFTVTMKLVTITITVFQLLYFFLASHEDSLERSSSVFSTLFLQLTVDCGILLVLFHLADIPVNQMMDFSKIVKDTNTATLTSSGKLEVELLLKSAEHERIRLSAGGLFSIGKHLIPGIAGTVITYIVIMLQAGGPQASPSAPG